MSNANPTQSSGSKDGIARSSDNAAAVHPETILRIKNLELRAKVVAEGFMSGLHRSPYQGFSVEFTDYRQYTPGDDLRYLDWKLYARADRHYIKRFEDETNLRSYLLVDLSKSMNFGSGEFRKLEYANTIAATLAYFFSLQRDGVGLLTFDEKIISYIPARFRPGHLRRLMVALEKTGESKSTNIANPLEEVARTVSKRGMVVLISDLLTPVEQFTKSLGYLRARGHDVMILRVLDPKDVSLEFESASMFRDLESGKEIYVDPATIGDDYRKRFEKHRNELKENCDQLGVDLFEMTTDEPLETAIFNVIQSRARRGRQVNRATQTGGRR
jgi:uncharacterized protein (DUF58 family)